MAVAMWHLESQTFAAEETIPTEHTCDGADTSPPLSWGPPPAGTQSIALIMHDPDAPSGDFTHWVLFNLPPQLAAIEPGVPPAGELPDGARQGRNDFGRLGYGGPCPPPGPAHRYVFALYALDIPLDLPAGSARAEVEAPMGGHVLARSELVGRYSRKGS